ncbi:hypothetical protein C1J03_06915 [Sulfitobacter sp. SK012]|uniref:hypothetical protein n=1 Tax=Sulfitobacter sp. SK012 TaxID=1389005 RepID=UPI000E0A446C|nr:hypothetical protein [Sulfitobacter sp. SK012]AXI45784.1 hypothetical protein C1J03_06915 [Sulfitobacter sp. SK012]
MDSEPLYSASLAVLRTVAHGTPSDIDIALVFDAVGAAVDQLPDHGHGPFADGVSLTVGCVFLNIRCDGLDRRLNQRPCLFEMRHVEPDPI